MVRDHPRVPIRWPLWLLVLSSALGAGCTVVPRSRLDESRRLTQALRAENARLKDEVVALQGQNRDLGDRAVDDQRRLAARDEAVERLERSVRAYQDERDRLAEAYEQFTAGLGRPDRVGVSRDPGPPGRIARGRPGPAPEEDRHPKGVTAVDDQETRP
jgi:hypothetical protein